MTYWEPSPEQIAEGTAAIRETWDAATEESRRAGGFDRQAWSVPGSHQNAEIVDAETLHSFAGPNC